MSRRADIFSRLLPHINAGRYFEWDGHIVFGATSVEELIERLTALPINREDPQVEGALLKIFGEAVVHGGRKFIAERASLGDPPTFKMDALIGLSPEQLDRFKLWFES
jgi:hypothetical protein